MIKKFVLFLVTCFTGVVFAQNVEFRSSNFKDKKEAYKKIESALDQGDALWKAGNEAVFNVSDYGLNYKKALKFYQEAQAFNPNNGELNFKIGVCYVHSTDPSKAIPFIKRAKELDSKCNPFLNYYYGYVLQLEGKFQEAVASYVQFEDEYRKADNFSKFIFKRKNECKLLETAMQKPERVWIDNVSELNSKEDDIAPSISTDGSELIMSSNRNNGKTTNEVGEYDYDIFSSSLTNGNWSKPKHLVGKINTDKDDVANAISYDGTKMLLHQNVNGQTDIFESKLVGAE